MIQQLKISTGQSRKDIKWKNIELSWDKLLEKLSQTTRTRETYLEYTRMTKLKQSAVKDVGGFVGGHLAGGRRKNGNVLLRSIITLDADYANKTFWEDLIALNDFACCIYSTHKHKKDNPRLRLCVPLSRTVTPDEYEAVARRLAADINIELFDDTTYQPTRLMYWPSTSEDAEFVFKKQEGEWLNPDNLLNDYVDWQDATTWPQSSRVNELHKNLAKKQGDPTEKEGLIGAFCRAYSIQETIDKFLSDVYEPCNIQNRYTYTHGSTAAGVVTYNDMFIYSNHATDPASSKLCNGFDIVRIHKFGDLDVDAKEGTPVNRLPSFKAMSDFISEDESTKKLMAEEKILSMFGESDATEEENEKTKENFDWIKDLDVDGKQNILPTIFNFRTIMEKDPNLKGIIGYNTFTYSLNVIGSQLPWFGKHDERGKEEREWDNFDEACLMEYIEKNYSGICSQPKIKLGIATFNTRHRFNSIKRYIGDLEWDGVERIDTALIDFFGAEDSEYTRRVTRNFFIGAVARVFVPGCKMDNMLILIGVQGTGKSTFFRKLAHKEKWFNDSLSDFKGKDSKLNLHGSWIVELSELATFGKNDSDVIKQFVSSVVDKFRKPYDSADTFYPRQNIFVGTTNETEILKDSTGNRRFWPVQTHSQKANLKVFTDLTPTFVNQLWAEAKTLYLNGCQWHEDTELATLAEIVRSSFMELNPKVDMIKDYLEILLPEDWDAFNQEQRIDYISSPFEQKNKGVIRRNKVCANEIYYECLRGLAVNHDTKAKRAIKEAMRMIPGWEEKEKVTIGGIYGRQRGFERNCIKEK